MAGAWTQGNQSTSWSLGKGGETLEGAEFGKEILCGDMDSALPADLALCVRHRLPPLPLHPAFAFQP